MSSEEKLYFNAFAGKQSLLGECNTFASELKNSLIFFPSPRPLHRFMTFDMT